MLRLSRLCLEMAPELKLEYYPLIFSRTILGPQGGFAGEERLIKREIAEKYIAEGTAALPNDELRRGVWCYNPDTNQYDRFIERTDEFLEFAARKRQWLDVYWRVNTGYLLFGRQSWGQGWLLNCPLRTRDVAQKLWEQYKVRVDPRLIELRSKDRATGIQELGHNWCWLYLPGAEELGIDREVYDNKRVKGYGDVEYFTREEALRLLLFFTGSSNSGILLPTRLTVTQLSELAARLWAQRLSEFPGPRDVVSGAPSRSYTPLTAAGAPAAEGWRASAPLTRSSTHGPAGSYSFGERSPSPVAPPGLHPRLHATNTPADESGTSGSVDPNRKVCKQFRLRGYCSFGSRCLYHHSDGNSSGGLSHDYSSYGRPDTSSGSGSGSVGQRALSQTTDSTVDIHTTSSAAVANAREPAGFYPMDTMFVSAGGWGCWPPPLVADLASAPMEPAPQTAATTAPNSATTVPTSTATPSPAAQAQTTRFALSNRSVNCTFVRPSLTKPCQPTGNRSPPRSGPSKKTDKDTKESSTVADKLAPWRSSRCIRERRANETAHLPTSEKVE